MTSITLTDVSLDYIVKSGTDSLKKSLLYFGRRRQDYSLRHSSFRALDNISLSLQPGDRVGLIGRNGAGKSTLLRVLAKIYKPRIGKIQINGNIAGLFDVCLGMDPEATGYENILNLAMMRGFSKKESLSFIPEIEEFTELSSFLHGPVRTYSTGMQMKLAFAVATARPADIMLVDEIIGAGDAHFMKKATDRLTSVVKDSQILVLSSHSNDVIERFCNKVLVLEKGKIQFLGSMQEGLQFYESL